MLVTALAFLAHVLFGPLVALLIILVREAIFGRAPSRLMGSLFGLIPIFGWWLAAFWPSRRYPDPAYDPRFYRYDTRQGYTQR